MELAQYILTGILYVIIYGFSTLFIFQFLLDISIAFEKQCISKVGKLVNQSAVNETAG